MISSTEMIRIRRQMQRRIQDVVAERRRARQLEARSADLHTIPTQPAHPDPATTQPTPIEADSTPTLTPTA
ncbi:hypothetical protein K7640_21535 [Micromonospora sp. PLK6-60]|uniref:hypothetical protein n=1 Tax=Micromonospora sp. PLK6-60 TaxID=2873383 RepID=UPI001CA79BFD|nr:hypothetical protein [Micromonospora sp. PLK6-60]MBY8874415.1 hypothetical protein [Micromonospora sp. PLK6-60]